MSAKRKAARVAVGLRAMRGGAVTVGVALEKGEPHVVLSSFLATAAEGDRLAFEPYHVAAEMCPDGKVSAEAKNAVAEGRRRQTKLAAQGLKDITGKLQEAGCEPAIATLLVNRAGWVTDLLAYSVAFADHPPVAEGLAVREALRVAIGRAGVKIEEVDEKLLPDLASEALGLGSVALDARLKTLGEGVKPWRKEQKLACLAAWLMLAREA